MNQFESPLYDMVQNIEFEKVKFYFPMQLSTDVNNIKKNPKILVPVHKSNNLYELTTEEYNKLQTENISKTYKQITVSAMNPINTEAKAIAKDLNLDERIEQYNQTQSFISLKTISKIFRTTRNADWKILQNQR